MTIPHAQSCNVCFNSRSYCSFLCTFLYLLFPKLAINITVISVILLASSEQEGPSPIFGVLMSYDVNKYSCCSLASTDEPVRFRILFLALREGPARLGQLIYWTVYFAIFQPHSPRERPRRFPCPIQRSPRNSIQ